MSSQRCDSDRNLEESEQHKKTTCFEDLQIVDKNQITGKNPKNNNMDHKMDCQYYDGPFYDPFCFFNVQILVKIVLYIPGI